MLKYEQWCVKHLSVKSRFGDEVLTLCPFHDNKTTPSCSVNMRKGLFVCYSCGEKGHISKMAKRVGSPLTAVYDAGAIGQGLDRLRTLGEASEAVQRLPESWLDRFKWEKPHRYWTEERGFDPETCRQWKLGYDSSHNAGTIPIRDVQGNVLGVVRRHIGRLRPGMPRYMYPKGFKISWHLFGAHLMTGVKAEQVVLTEGSLDAIAMNEAGFHAVALLGARLHPHQLTIMSGFDVDRVTLMLDNDEAGIHAAQVVSSQLQAEGFNVYMARRFKGVKDAGEMSEAQRVAAIDHAQSYLRLRLKAVGA